MIDLIWMILCIILCIVSLSMVFMGIKKESLLLTTMGQLLAVVNSIISIVISFCF